ncbi:MAG: glutamate-1-semialdehyde 2,1-aminomutase [Terriglobales bacterium]
MPLKLDHSRELHQRALALMPGGVNSPVRAFGAVGGDPPFLVRGLGARVWDADDNEYVDYVGSWGPLILGHAAPEVVAAVEEAARKGTSFGASTPSEADLAEIITDAMPTLEKVRFVNSGTEATMTAVRLARAFTGRKYIIKFEGCYHGHSDALLVKAGSGVATLGIPGSAGVLDVSAQFTLALPYNNIEAVQQAFQRLPSEIAAIIVEPVAGNMGCVPPAAGFLDALRYLTSRNQTLLIFDEVMTGFRLAFGGAQGRYGVVPDLTTLGKIIGGGLPVGAYGGPAELMDMVAPLGPVYQAGTLSGNPLAMAAGLATLRYLRDNRRHFYNELEARAHTLVTGTTEAAHQNGVALTHNQVGSMFTWFFTNTTVRDFATASESDTKLFGRFHRAMLELGVFLPPSQFEACFLSGAHTDDDVSRTIQAAPKAFASL